MTNRIILPPPTSAPGLPRSDLATTLNVESLTPRLPWQSVEREKLVATVPTEAVEIAGANPTVERRGELDLSAPAASRGELSRPWNRRMVCQPEERVLQIGGGKTIRVTPVFDSYWRFAAARQELFVRRIGGEPPPWTSDPIIAAYRFTNAYRASDRVSQYLIRNVIYDGPQTDDEVFFRTLLFKLFNRVGTWELLMERLGGTPTWKGFQIERYARILDAAFDAGERLYSAAYIMPPPPFGSPRKHRNHLQLLAQMMREHAPTRVSRAKSLECVYGILRSYPSFGDFLAFQFTIDLNYSELINFSEMDFVVAGPGARDGIKKCFTETAGLSEADIIRHVARIADEEFERLGLRFTKLGGRRSLQLIDCQNLFCETDKYARVAHPDFAGAKGRTRIKQKFAPSCEPLPQFYPPKWGLAETPHTRKAKRRRASAQLALELTPAE